MPTRYINTLLASNGDGTSGNPWNLIPGTDAATAAGISVVANDPLYIQIGSSTNGQRLTPPSNGLQYLPWDAYGTGEPLYLDLPHPLAPWITRRVKVNDGMWSVHNATGAGQCVNIPAARTNVVLDSVRVSGDAGAAQAVTVGVTTTTAQSGFTMRRSLLQLPTGSTAQCMTASTLNILLEFCKLNRGGQDTLVFATHANNSQRAGSVDIVRWCEIGPANTGVITAVKDSQPGDELQYQIGTAAAGLGSLVLQGCYLRRISAGKQCLLVGAQGNHRIIGNLFEADADFAAMTGLGADTPNGASIFLNSPWGIVLVAGNAMRNRTVSGLPLIRVAPGEGVTDAMTSASDITIERNLMVGAGGAHQAFRLTGPVTGGALRVRQNTTLGLMTSATDRTSSSAAGAGFTYAEENNAWLAQHTAQALVWGNVDAKHSWRGNRWRDGSAYRVNGTDYASLSAATAGLVAAGATATSLGEVDAGVTTAQGIPLPGSPLLSGGADLGPRRDIRGFQSRRHIGAYGAARMLRTR